MGCCRFGMGSDGGKGPPWPNIIACALKMQNFKDGKHIDTHIYTLALVYATHFL